MRYRLRCTICGSEVWIRGSHEDDTNATELNDGDPNWKDCCEHIQNGDYEILEGESDDDYE